MTTKLTDEKIIKKHAPSVRGRAKMELQIVNKLIKTAKDAGFTLHIEDFTTSDMASYGNDFKTALFDLDEATVLVLKNGSALGWISLAFGNDGYDLISDYTTNLETFLAPVNALSDSLADC